MMPRSGYRKEPQETMEDEQGQQVPNPLHAEWVAPPRAFETKAIKLGNIMLTALPPAFNVVIREVRPRAHYHARRIVLGVVGDCEPVECMCEGGLLAREDPNEHHCCTWRWSAHVWRGAALTGKGAGARQVIEKPRLLSWIDLSFNQLEEVPQVQCSPGRGTPAWTWCWCGVG